MKEIQALKNPLIKETKKLLQKKYRQQSQSYLLEGFHLVQEAVKAQVPLKNIFISRRGQQEWSKWFKGELGNSYLVSDEVLKSLASQPTPQGIIAVAEMTAPTEINFSGAWLLLDKVQDPGNVGTLIRTADAAGFSGVVLGEGSADLFNAKTLRSTQGSHFHLPVISRDLREIFAAKTAPIFGTALDEKAKNYRDVPALEDFFLLLGNEGQGVSPELLAQTDQNLYIPIKGQAESLNVAIAGGILMFQLKK